MKPPADDDCLVIGYGNTLRRDDGVGAKIAEAVAEWELPGVRSLVRHQLTPELAEILSQARVAVFVDAQANAPDGAELTRIEPAAGAQILAHATDPRALLALAQHLFGRCPIAWTLAIPADDFGYGEGLSLRAQAGMRAALKQIRTLARKKFHDAIPGKTNVLQPSTQLNHA